MQMTYRAPLTVVAVLLLATGAVQAAGSLKTNVWVDMCTSKDGTAKKIACTSYTLGLYDGLILWHANSKDPIKILCARGKVIC
jgi:hypothetical protein